MQGEHALHQMLYELLLMSAQCSTDNMNARTGPCGVVFLLQGALQLTAARQSACECGYGCDDSSAFWEHAATAGHTGA